MGVASDSLIDIFKIKVKRISLLRPAALLIEGMRTILGVADIGFTNATIRDGIRLEMLERLEQDNLTTHEPSGTAPKLAAE